MANSKQAKKRARQSLRRRDRNRAVRTRLRGAVKELRTAVATGDLEKAEELLPSTIRLIDVTRRKKVIHRNAAARSKSRLVRLVRSAREQA